MNYKKGKVAQSTGQHRAHKLYPIMGKCELCNEPAYDIHHIDRDRTNNKRENLMFLCRHHHMEIDGRLVRLVIKNKNAPKLKTLKKCINCGVMSYPLRKGRCHACNEYLRRNGVDKKIIRNNDGLVLQCCPECNNWFELKTKSKTYCDDCARIILLQRHAKSERERRKKVREKGVSHGQR